MDSELKYMFDQKTSKESQFSDCSDAFVSSVPVIQKCESCGSELDSQTTEEDDWSPARTGRVFAGQLKSQLSSDGLILLAGDSTPPPPRGSVFNQRSADF